MRFLWARRPSCDPTISTKALKETQSTNCHQWPGLILSSSTTGLIMEGATLALWCQYHIYGYQLHAL